MVNEKEWQGHKGILINSVTGYDIIDCQGCRFKHMIPLPSEEKMEEYYSETFLKKRPGYIEKHLEDLDWLSTVYSDRYEMFEEYLSVENRRILDIGCGLGFFLDEGRKRDWQTFGIEPSKQAADYAKGLGIDIETGTLNEKNVNHFGRFDVVHLHEVLEHIPNPAKLLQLVKQLLQPQALVCITVPNDYNPFQIALRDNLGFSAWWEGPPEHINYFNFDSLKEFIFTQGFDVVSISSTFPMEIFLFMGERYVGNRSIGHECHGRRKRFELALEQAGMKEFKKRLYQSFSELGIGREVVMLARKKA